MKQLKLLSLLSVLLLLVACGNESSDTSSNESSENGSDGAASESDQGNTESENKEDDKAKEYDLNILLQDAGVEVENNWIQEDGTLAPNKEFVVSEPIEYDPNNTYSIQLSSYVSYFKNDEFIKTIRYSADESKEIESVSEANQIKISYRPDTIK